MATFFSSLLAGAPLSGGGGEGGGGGGAKATGVGAEHRPLVKSAASALESRTASFESSKGHRGSFSFRNKATEDKCAAAEQTSETKRECCCPANRHPVRIHRKH